MDTDLRMSSQETLSYSGADSCSTALSSAEAENVFVATNVGLASGERESKRCFMIRVRCLAKVLPQGKKRHISLESTPIQFVTQASQEMTNFSSVLRLNRDLFRECWHSTPLVNLGEYIKEILHDASLHVSSSHADVTLHLIRKRSRVACGDTKEFVCKSIDVVDYVGKTILNSVPLHPFHRYHFRMGEWNTSGVKKSTVTLWATRHVAFQIDIPVSTAATQSPLNMKSADSRKNASAPLNIGALNSSKTSSAAPPSHHIIFTSGISLSDGEVASAKRRGVVLNPDFRHVKTAPILVAGKSLMRSVKLLSVLPHVETIVQHKWLKEWLKQPPTSPPPSLAKFQFREVNRKGSIESDNQFSLSDFLAIPVEARERLFSGLTFWVHPDAVPQDPPRNDLKSVILHSGGAISADLTSSDIFVVPAYNTVVSLPQSLSSSEQRRIASNCSVVTPDTLFKSVLRHNVEDLRSHSLPVGLLDT